MRHLKLLKWAHTVWTLLGVLALVAAVLDQSYAWAFYATLLGLTMTTGFLALCEAIKHQRAGVLVTTIGGGGGTPGASAATVGAGGGGGKAYTAGTAGVTYGGSGGQSSYGAHIVAGGGGGYVTGQGGTVIPMSHGTEVRRND
jgi:hypothetical protein